LEDVEDVGAQILGFNSFPEFGASDDGRMVRAWGVLGGSTFWIGAGNAARAGAGFIIL
jgi:hypothetical protein